jgi:PBSX family phage terminase large subunit
MDQVLLEAALASIMSLASAGPNAINWLTADLSYLLHDGQIKIEQTLKQSPHQLQVVLCARGFGKTYWGATLAVSQALKKPKSRIKIATEFQTDLESLILPNFEAVLQDCPDDLRPIWKSSKSKFIFPNNSEISLIGLDRKPNGLRGQHGIDLIILEEAGFITKLESIYRSVIVPITTHRPNCKIVLISTPPESLDHYFWSFVDRAEQSGSLSTFTIDENPMLTPKDIARLEEEMGGRESTQFQREYLCMRVAEQSRMVVPEFSENNIQDYPRPSYFEYLLKSHALDSGVRDLTVGLWAYYDFLNAKVIVEDEIVLKGKEVLTQNIFDQTISTEQSLKYSKVTRHADNNNLILIQDLNYLGATRAMHWSPTRKDAVEASVNLVRTWLSQGRVVINPRCKHLIGTLKTALWNKTRTDFHRSEVYGHADAVMALVYLLRNVNTSMNPIPQTFQVDIANSFIITKPTESKSAKSLKTAFQLKGKS